MKTYCTMKTNDLEGEHASVWNERLASGLSEFIGRAVHMCVSICLPFQAFRVWISEHPLQHLNETL